MGSFFNANNSPDGEDIENIDPSPRNVKKSLGLIEHDDVTVAEVSEMLTSSFKNVLLHINTKRILAEEFEINLFNSINLITCALTHTGPTRTMVICTE